MKFQDSSLERVEQFKRLETTKTNKYYTQEEFKGRMKSGNFCSHLMQNLLSSILLSKNVRIKRLTEV
jgi:hypothetical protein